ncbi:neuronal acetylcholine receptor subunit alpha-2-like [Penaeus vannamei]|uniref:neuronal acetylcholine receptor subunit alpha-2-like n=1 Tax=Penaeus vannamei TaxID=6689 RepID=UPI00387F709D
MAVPAQASDPRRVECLRRNLALPPRGGPFPPQIEMNFCSQTGVFAGVRPRISLGGILFSGSTTSEAPTSSTSDASSSSSSPSSSSSSSSSISNSNETTPAPPTPSPSTTSTTTPKPRPIKLEENDEKRLLDDLMLGYDRDVRPVKNASHPIVIQLGITLTQIFDMDEKNQVLTTNVWLDQEWVDELLHWDPNDYNGLETIRLPCERIWLPDIVLYNK